MNLTELSFILYARIPDFSYQTDTIATSKLTFSVYPYGLDSSKINVVKEGDDYKYILNTDTLPSYDGRNTPMAYQFPTESCTDLSNCESVKCFFF